MITPTLSDADLTRTLSPKFIQSSLKYEATIFYKNWDVKKLVIFNSKKILTLRTQIMKVRWVWIKFYED